MQAFISYFNIYPTRISLSYKGKKGFHTFVGAVLSICTFILILLAFMSMGLDMIYKTNPNVIAQNMKQVQRPWQYIGINNYSFSFVFSNAVGLVQVPPTYFSFEVGQTIMSLTGIFQKPIPTTQCNVSYFKGFETQFYDPFPVYNISQCLDLKVFELGGY